MSDELDPEISALLGSSGGAASDAEPVEDLIEDVETLDDDVGAGSSFGSDFGNMFGASSGQARPASASSGPRTIHDVDLSKTGFNKLEKLVNDTPSDVYDDPKYTKPV